MKKRKLIVSDIDGTLLNSHKKISEKTKRRIEALIESGHVFAVATGRMHGAGKTITTELDYDGFLISCNGAVVKHLKSGEVIQAIEVDPDIVRKVVSVCQTYEATYFFYEIDTIYASAYKHLAKTYSEKMVSLPESHRFTIEFPMDMLEIVGTKPIYKIAISHDDKVKFRKLIDEIRTLSGIESVKSLDTLFDVMTAGVSKAKGIEALQRHFGIDREDVIAFGDNENDIDMVSYAGIGVAMSNAMEELKVAADFVTKSNDEEGLVYALDHFGID